MRGIAVSAIAAAAALLSAPAIAAMMAPPSITITSPASGATVHGSSIPVKVAVNNFNFECTNVGKTNAPMGEGHLHAMVDGMDMEHLVVGPGCSKSFSFSGQGLAPGKHMLTVVLATDAHVMSSMPASIPFNYEPSGSSSLPNAMTGKPAVRILSPRSGASVDRKFNLVLAVNNFDLSCDLEGKKDVDGWGHVHVFVQQAGETTASPSAPLVAMMKTPQGMKMGQRMMKQTGMSMDQLNSMMTMGMPAMVSMPCAKTLPMDLSSWHSGPAKIIVQLAKNDHMPTAGAAPVIIDVNLK